MRNVESNFNRECNEITWLRRALAGLKKSEGNISLLSSVKCHWRKVIKKIHMLSEIYCMSMLTQTFDKTVRYVSSQSFNNSAFDCSVFLTSANNTEVFSTSLCTAFPNNNSVKKCSDMWHWVRWLSCLRAFNCLKCSAPNQFCISLILNKWEPENQSTPQNLCSTHL